MPDKKTYKTWVMMRQRCFNPNDRAFRHYGGRGISICSRWSSFTNFLQDMGERPGLEFSLDRIDNSRGYYPDNCRWATAKQQANNRRSNRIITVGSVSKTLSEWSEATSLKSSTIRMRLDAYGWSPEKAVGVFCQT